MSERGTLLWALRVLLEARERGVASAELEEAGRIVDGALREGAQKRLSTFPREQREDAATDVFLKLYTRNPLASTRIPDSDAAAHRLLRTMLANQANDLYRREKARSSAERRGGDRVLGVGDPSESLAWETESRWAEALAERAHAIFWEEVVPCAASRRSHERHRREFERLVTLLRGAMESSEGVRDLVDRELGAEPTTEEWTQARNRLYQHLRRTKQRIGEALDAWKEKRSGGSGPTEEEDRELFRCLDAMLENFRLPRDRGGRR